MCINNTQNINVNSYAPQQRNWRAIIISLYSCKCFITGEPLGGSEPLEAHHLYGQRSFPEKALDVTNGVLIKQSIHYEFHRLYGRINNVPEQFEEFLAKRYNIKNFPWRTSVYNENCLQIEKRFKKSPEFFDMRLKLLAEERGHSIISYVNEDNVYVNKYTIIIIGCKKHGLIESKETPYKKWSFTEKKKVMDYNNQVFRMCCCANENAKQKADVRSLSGLRTKKVEVFKAKDNTKELSSTKVNLVEKPAVDIELQKKFYNNFNKPQHKNKPNKTIEKHNFMLESIKKNNHIFNGCLDCSIILNYSYPIFISCPHHNKSYETTSNNYLRNNKGLPCCSEEQGKNKARNTINKLFKELSEFINSEDSA